MERLIHRNTLFRHQSHRQKSQIPIPFLFLMTEFKGGNVEGLIRKYKRV